MPVFLPLHACQTHPFMFPRRQHWNQTENIPAEACFFLAAAETWPTNCFVLQCRFSLGQRALSLLEAPRGADDRCTGWWDERKANGMLLFQRGESPPWKPSMCLVNVSSLFVFHAAMWQCFPTLLERRMNWSWGKERCFWCWNAVRMAGSRARPCTRARLECFLGTTWAPSAGQVILISILYTHTHTQVHSLSHPFVYDAKL